MVWLETAAEDISYFAEKIIFDKNITESIYM
jgi:hypothetical protein